MAFRPDQAKELLTKDQARIYELIWKRLIASQMKPQILDVTTVNIEAGDYMLRASGSSVRFAGFTLVYSESKEEEEREKSDKVPSDITGGDELILNDLFPEQHFTKPPPRYTEAVSYTHLTLPTKA